MSFVCAKTIQLLLFFLLYVLMCIYYSCFALIALQLVSHYTLFADDLWCALGDPAKKSFDFISMRGNGLMLSRNNTINLERNWNLFNTRTIKQSGGGTSFGSSAAGSIKLKEWFTTINHKWSKIKRQIPNVSQFGAEPFENYDERQLLSSRLPAAHQHHCCHCQRRRSNLTLRNVPSKYIDKPLPFVSASNNSSNEVKDHDYVDIDESLTRNGNMIRSTSCDGLMVSKRVIGVI